MGQEGLAAYVNYALRVVRLDDLDGWFASFPPPCNGYHGLTEILPDHENGPAFVMQPTVENHDSTLGMVVLGRSRFEAADERAPLVERLSPRLGAMSFTAVLAADIHATFREIYHHRPLEAMCVRLPLNTADNLLSLDTGRLTQDDADLALLCLDDGATFLR